MKLTVLLAVVTACTMAASPAWAQDGKTGGLTSAERTEKQLANEDAEKLCRRFQDTDKFHQCLNLYFLDAAKFKAFLDANRATAGVRSDPTGDK